jgi:FtsP/CotA-like multicopper oxidase with cupredoxin domain
VVLAPSERAVVDVLVDQPGELQLEHRTPRRTYPLATIEVGEAQQRPASPAAAAAFELLREAPELVAERQQLDAWLAAPPDKVLALVAQMDDPAAMPADAGPVTYACPMHPEVTSDEPGRCPKCGMKLLAVTAGTQEHTPMDHSHMDHGAMDHSGADGIEWEDDMVEVNRLTTTATMHWKFLDRTSGADSPTIDWHFTVGDRVKLRLVNEMDSDHPCTTPSTCTGPGGSWYWLATGCPSRTWSGRTRSWSAPARSWTSCSTCPTRGCGWRIATSPSTCRAA